MVGSCIDGIAGGIFVTRPQLIQSFLNAELSPQAAVPVWVLSQAATPASTASPDSVLAPLRKTSISGSENVPRWVSSKTLVPVTAYHSFGGEVEALNTPRYAALPFHAVTNFRP
jgi:hypothetical protein